MTYTLLNACFLIPAALLAWSTRKRIPTGPWLLTAAVLIALTIIFDNIMIGVGLFYYSPETSSGITIGLMPIEDLSYTVFAVLVLPALWAHLLQPRTDRAARGGGGERHLGSGGDRRLVSGGDEQC
ncbi:lycopene cyclase domain-containing protein [Brevibacterium sp. HMSC24B04]|uniref:lycopene cyclase domain-containing protein n=1 Tax=Brevibacterium sp. HMSC24B04 TaxID=1581060 RepID=UPI0008A1714F|nr:lycopene cyclase domain-containing protein [Brevibacterium sp. HMSC24B04]OFT93544.1 lycopene e-cyclase isoprenoid transferase B [Brevibacterium sp. HMSC24B04]HJH12196.1 lycopene cyclase domain-containing protein [Brevibacterium ravenspurgense]